MSRPGSGIATWARATICWWSAPIPAGLTTTFARGNPAEHAAALRAIAAVPMPAGAILSPAAKVPGPGSGAPPQSTRAQAKRFDSRERKRSFFAECLRQYHGRGARAGHCNFSDHGAAMLAPLVARPIAARAGHVAIVSRLPANAATAQRQALQPMAAGPLWNYADIPFLPPAPEPAPPARQVPRLFIQAKCVRCEQLGDPREHEADTLADQVLRTPDAAIAIASATSRISYKCAACEEEEQRANQTTAAVDMPSLVHHVLRARGRRLDDATRGFFEQRFRHDFSNVRIHAGAAAAQSAQALNARAYTVGQDIVFGPGEFLPGTQAGRRLLAHELTHVVQQAGGAASPALVPGPAQERDAAAATRAVVAGETPCVRAPSRVGLAAQPKIRLDDPSLYKPIDPKNEGLKIVTAAEVEALVNRVIERPGWKAKEARDDFNASPARAKANLLSSHYRDETERLSYALGFYEEVLGAGGGGDRYELVVALVKHETQALTRAGAIVVHSPPTKAEERILRQARAEHARREYQAYQDEIARLEAEADARTVAKTGVYSGAATVDVYQQFVGAPVEALAETLKEQAAPITSMMLDFVPFLGQVKTLVEGIIGKDLITGEKLPDWQRGLNILLAIIPEAKGIFTASRGGIRILARVAVDSGQDAGKVYRAAKLASRLTEEEVQAAENLVAGARPTPAQVKIARNLQEMEGGVAAEPVPLESFEPVGKGAAKAAKATAAELENIRQTTHLAGKNHTLSLKRAGKQLFAWLCSNGCGALIRKARAMIARLPKGDAARVELRKFVEEVETHATWIDVLPTEETAVQELERLTQQLEDIEKRFPHAVQPDIHVSSEPPVPAEPAPTEHEPAVAEPAPAEPAAAPAVLPADPAAQLRFARSIGLNAETETGRQILANLAMTAEDYIGEFRAARVLGEFPAEFKKKTVWEALRDGDSTVRKLLTDGRWAK
jgi:Domain of unknown function (DUF4157)/Pre-toxin TG